MLVTTILSFLLLILSHPILIVINNYLQKVENLTLLEAFYILSFAENSLLDPPTFFDILYIWNWTWDSTGWFPLIESSGRFQNKSNLEFLFNQYMEFIPIFNIEIILKSPWSTALLKTLSKVGCCWDNHQIYLPTKFGKSGRVQINFVGVYRHSEGKRPILSELYHHQIYSVKFCKSIPIRSNL